MINAATKLDQQNLGKASLQHQMLYLSAVQALGEAHRNRGGYEVAEPLFQEALTICRENLLEEESFTGEVYTSLAAIESVRGDLQKCREYHDCALDNRTRNFGRNHPKTAATLSHLARLHVLNCEYAQAGKLLQECRTVLESYYGHLQPTHPTICNCTYWQARLHMALFEHPAAEVLLKDVLNQRIEMFGDRHPSVAQVLCALADLHAEQMRLDEANRLYESVLLICREAFGEHPHVQIIHAMFGTAMVAAKQNRFAESMPIFEECIELRKTVLASVNGRYHTDLATMTMHYASVALTMGMTNDAASLFGQSGADQYSSFRSEQHLRVADSLYHMANVSKALGRYKDAKYQYSVCMSVRYRYLGRTHPDVLDVLYAACDNMRLVGYFLDATDAVNALETLTAECFGKDSLQEAIVHKMKAHIHCDKGAFLKAEALYQSALSTIYAKFGDTNIHVLEIKIGLARCLLLQLNLADAEKAFKDAAAMSRQLLGPSNHVTVDCISNIAMTKLNRKPDIVQVALTTLKEQVVPFYSSVYGASHPYTAHANGRVGLFMNCLKKESGRKYVQKALKVFDEYKQFTFTQDHPWVLELGGFVKRSSQDRLSHSIEVQALSAWCMPRFEGDVNYGTAPKHFWVDLSNNAADAWGAVHYYGLEKEPSVAVLPIIQQAREERDETPAASRAGTAVASEKRPTRARDTSPKATRSSADASAVAAQAESAEGTEAGEGTDLAHALAAEVQARKDVEDLLENELASRKTIEDQLEAEQLARKEIDERLAAEQEERRKLEAQYKETLRQMQELAMGKLAAAATVDSTAPVVEMEAAPPASEALPMVNPADFDEGALDAALGPDDDGADGTEGAAAPTDSDGIAAVADTEAPKRVPSAGSRRPTSARPPSAKARPASATPVVAGNAAEGATDVAVDAAASGADTPLGTGPDAAAPAKTSTVVDSAANALKMKADLEAADFLFARAMELQAQGWYRKAHPLFSECLLVRQRYLPNEELTINTMSSLARNHCLLNEWDTAEEVIQPCMKLAEKVCKIESLPFAEALLVKGENLLQKGLVADAVKSLNKSTKLITKIMERVPAAAALLGRSVCLQALANLRIGKIPESKAMADRGAALLSKAYGINHVAVVEAVHVKCEILLHTSKFKEATAQVEQAYTVRRRLLGDTHPAVADCLLFMGIALVGIGKLQEGQTKFNTAREIRLEYFGEESLEYAEVLFHEAQLCAKLCEYQESLRKNLEVMRIRQANLWEKHPTVSDSYLALGMLYTSLGQYVDADKNLLLAMNIRSALPLDAKTFHPLVAQAKCAQSELLRMQGDYEAARPLIEEAVEEYKVLYGKENADYLHASQCFGLLLHDSGDLENADKLNKRTIKYRRQILGAEHPDLAASLLYQIDVLIDRHLYAEALVMLTEASIIVKMHYSDCAAHWAMVQIDLIHALVKMGELEQQRAEGDAPKPEGEETAEAKNPTAEAPAEAEFSTTAAAGEALYQHTSGNVRDDDSDTQASRDDAPPEEISAPPAEPEPEVDPTPVFPNEIFLQTAATIQAAVAQLQSMYHINLRKTRAGASSKRPNVETDTVAVGSGPGAVLALNQSNVPQHPMVIYLQGCVGNTMLLEHLAKQRFAEALSPQDRELFNNRESFLRLQSKEVKLKPAGLPELEVAVAALSKYPTSIGVLSEEHYLLKKLKEAVSNVVFVLDDLEIAANTFIEAGQLHKKAKFSEADAKYDEVFITQLTSLGAAQASTSLVVAETLFAKAENSRFLGEIELSKMLYNQSISIFRKQLGGDNEGVMKGILGLTALLSWQGLYEESYAMRTRILPVYVKLFTEQSLQVAQLKTDIAFDLLKLAKFDKGHKIIKETLYILTHMPGAMVREELCNARVILAQIYLAQGNFASSKEQIDQAQALLEGEHHLHAASQGAIPGTAASPPISDDILLPMSSLLECKAEFLLVHSKLFEAQKTMTRALKMRVKVLGRTNRITEGNKNADRKQAFFDALDNLSAETGKNPNEDDEEGGGKFVNHSRMSKQDEADKQLDEEMQQAFDSIMEIGGFNDEEGASHGGASMPSSVRFGGKSSATRPPYQQRGIPVQSHPILADTLLLKGRISMVLGDFAECKELFDGAMGMLAEQFPKPSQKKLSVAYELADLTYRKGGLEDARTMHTNVLQQRLQLCDEDHPDKADSLFQIAMLNNLLSKYDDSTQILTEALTLRKRALGDLHWKVGEVFAECALVLHAKGFHQDSDALYDKALIIARKCFGDLHLLNATIHMGQASNARECGLLEQAKAYMEQATSMRGILLGEGHADTAYCMYQQALVMRCMGKILEVKRLLDTAIAIQREKLGKFHPQTAMTLLSMAINFMDLAKYTTATHVFNRAIQLIKKSFGKDHVLIAFGLTGMAENSRCQGLYEEARVTHEKALYLRRKLLGERHHSIAESVYFLGEIQLILAKFEDATKSFDDALALQRMALGQVHPAIATTMHGLGRVMLAQGRVGDAKSTHDRAYTIRKHCLAGDHPDIGDSQYSNALVYQKMGKYDQAAALFERCLNTVRDSRGARHPLVAAIIYHSAEVANYMGRYHQAESLLLEALQIRLTVFQDINENHPDIAETYFGLAENLRLRGKYDFMEESENGLPEVKKVFKALPKAAEPNAAPPAPYDIAASQVSSGMSGFDIAESILDGTAFAVGASQSTVRFNPVDDEATAPTVMLSAIENVDPPSPNNKDPSVVTFRPNESEIVDDFSIPQQVTDHRTLTDNAKVYKALPMYKRVLNHLGIVFAVDHPVLLSTQFAIAETTRLMGKYDLALENHQDILAVRRKLLGDNHPDTVLSMLAIGESLQGLGKIYPETASGSVDAKQVRMAKQAMSLGVSLLDHLSSLVAPVITEGTLTPLPPSAGASLMAPAPGSKPATAQGSRTGSAPPSPLKKKSQQSESWDFLSKPDVPKKKKEALKLPKGYMGYQFPTVKKIIRQESNSATRPKKVRTGDAKWLYDSGITAQKRNFGETSEHPVTASLLYAKGELLRARGDNSTALSHFDAALVMRRKLFRGNHPCIADCINSMAEVFRVENKFRQALPMYDKVLEIRMEAFDGSHPSIAEVKNNLAMLSFAEGRYPEAQKLFQEALAICEQLLGGSHPSTAGALTNLAGMLQAAGQHRLALPLYQRALAIKQLTYGEEHVEVASTLNNLGLLYKALGKYEESQANYEKALEIQRKLHGTSHKDIATTLNNLASLYVTLGKKYEAKEMYKDSVAMRSALFGVDHPTVAATLNNYAGLLFSMGEYEPAKDYFEDALRIRRKVLGENHPSVAETLNNIGLLLYTQGQLKDALPLYERALEIKRAAYGDMNPSVATSLNNLASLYHKVGHFDHAAALYQSAYDIRFAILGEVHDDTLAVEENLKAVKRDKHKWAATQGSKATDSVTSSEMVANSKIQKPVGAASSGRK